MCAQDWFCPYVQYVYENGIMQGTSETTFSPYATMTRGMVAQILYNQAKETDNIGEMGSETPVFSDVQADQWYFEAVQWAYANGKASGVGNGRFEPERQVTREELAMFLYRDARTAVYRRQAVLLRRKSSGRLGKKCHFVGSTSKGHERNR